MPKQRNYSELRVISTFRERYDYLQLRGVVGESTFGFDRYLNQRFYRSAQWKRVRIDVIARDEGRDLGIEGYEIYDQIYIHHMNPMRVSDIVHADESILDPEFLVCVTHDTHNAIHYGDANLLRRPYVPRRPGDTKLW